MLHSSAMGTNSSEIKSHNISAILLSLLHGENVSRAQLAQILGVSSATITNLVGELVEQGYVVESGIARTNGQVGRPKRVLQLVYDARFAVGVHIDVGQVHVILSNIAGQEVAVQTFQHAIDESYSQVLDTISETIERLIDRSPMQLEQVVGVGVAASGLVNVEMGVNIIAPNLNWYDVPIRDYLQQRLNLPVVVENNVRAMAFGEAMFGHARNVHVVAFIYGRIGVGAGLVVGGQLYRGAAAGAGEIGHTVVMICDSDGTLKPVTLETLVSEPAILQQGQELIANRPHDILAQLTNKQGMSSGVIYEAARAGDMAVLEMLRQRATYLGMALANLVNIFNPELIVLGGLYSRIQDLMLLPIEHAMRQYAFANLGQQVQIRTTQFGERAGMVGSAALALDRFFYRTQHVAN